MKRLFTVTAMVIALALSTTAIAAGEDDDCVDLLAGQHEVVGEVCVDNNSENLLVTYTTIDGWMLAETHLAVSMDVPGTGEWKDNGWQNGSGNPSPGQFPYSETHDPQVDTFTYVIPLADIGSGVGPEDFLYLGAHAVVEKEEIVLEALAPYYASDVVDSEQGPRKDGTDVLEARSDPEQALVREAATDDSKMFSLGFGGQITVTFECPIQNGGEGVDDFTIWEVTNPGSYPLESALVEVSQDGSTWFAVGTADNLTQEAGRHTQSDFDLTAAHLEWASFVRITDTSDADLFEPTADGFDLDGVQANMDCRITETESETAWGDGTRFVDRGNWATYFSYTVVEDEGLATGDIQVTLRWHSDADLDLHVTDPDGQKVYWANPNVASGGFLDIDANVDVCDTDAPPAVENIVWSDDDAIDGTYTVEVVEYILCGEASPEWNLVVKVGGAVVFDHTATGPFLTTFVYPTP